jgi:hypothetical protein
MRYSIVLTLVYGSLRQAKQPTRPGSGKTFFARKSPENTNHSSMENLIGLSQVQAIEIRSLISVLPTIEIAQHLIERYFNLWGTQYAKRRRNASADHDVNFQTGVDTRSCHRKSSRKIGANSTPARSLPRWECPGPTIFPLLLFSLGHWLWVPFRPFSVVPIRTSPPRHTFGPLRKH